MQALHSSEWYILAGNNKLISPLLKNFIHSQNIRKKHWREINRENSYYKKHDRLQNTFTLPSQASSCCVFQIIYGRKKISFNKSKISITSAYCTFELGTSAALVQWKHCCLNCNQICVTFHHSEAEWHEAKLDENLKITGLCLSTSGRKWNCLCLYIASSRITFIQMFLGINWFKNVVRQKIQCISPKNCSF